VYLYDWFCFTGNTLILKTSVSLFGKDALLWAVIVSVRDIVFTAYTSWCQQRLSHSYLESLLSFDSSLTES